MDLQNLQEKGKNVVNQVTNTLEEKGQQVKEQITNTTQDKASELSEEAITTAVDRAVNVMQIASKRVIEKDIPTENVSLEVSVNVMGLGQLKMKTDVPKAGEFQEVDVDVTEKGEAGGVS
ncbi:MAG: hypothetical protein RID53_29135 [Coleofasciculus sp. B1-GNL1-01]|uniref:hypothetical protein n=1 Tax=Coleofasciculus sp. B1-GNL1-01 TaxID=3068484 RepID=UPI0032FD38E8